MTGRSRQRKQVDGQRLWGAQCMLLVSSEDKQVPLIWYPRSLAATETCGTVSRQIPRLLLGSVGKMV
jgi:hypothetical protein